MNDSNRRRAPLVLYELNEVPWRVIDWYLAHRPSAALAEILKNSRTYTTITRDEGELHPWTTWPSLHRGVYNTEHRIRFLNQDKSCADGYPTIWETAANAGVKVGVFGSLQSYPVPQGGSYAFYVPDTFARGPETHPPDYSIFQRVNLRQTRADGAEAAPVKLDGRFVGDVLSLRKIGVTARTYAMLAVQLVRERFDRRYKTRRAMLQAPVAFDVFWHALNRHEPEFTTFFTNHVAGVMHRYWKYAFPEDFGHPPGTKLDDFHSDSLLAAMDIADEQVSRLQSYVDARGGQLVIASSMGQEAIDRGEYHGEIRIVNAKTFARAIGFDRPFIDHLAMQPDFNLEFETLEDRERFSALVRRLVDDTGAEIFKRHQWQGATINLGLGNPRELVERELLLIRENDGRVKSVPFAQAGLRKLWRDPGTGYHQPCGSLIWYRAGQVGRDDRTEIESAGVRGMLLEAL